MHETSTSPSPSGDPVPPRRPTLPAPARAAGWLLRRAWGPDGEVVEGDVAEAYEARRRQAPASPARLRAWLWGWSQILRTVLHGIVTPSPSGLRVRGGLRPMLALRLAARGLRRDPGTSWVAVGTLALGLAAPVTFASLVFGAIRPLPVPDGDRVVRVEVHQPRDTAQVPRVTAEELEAWAGAGSLEAVGGVRTFGATWVDRGAVSTRIAVAALTPSVLPLLRVRPVLGTVPDPGDAATGPGVLLGHRPWTELYGADPAVVGRTVVVDGRALRVTGVMPRGFRFPYAQDAWVIDGPSRPGTPYEAVGRLAPGASSVAATTELQGMWQRRDGLRPPATRGAVVEVRGFTRGRGEAGEAMAFLGLVLVAVALLVIAAANVANLLLVRATERVRALGIQAALGAGREQIALQILMEAALLAGAGGVVGVAVAAGVVEWIQAVGHTEHFGYFWMRMAVDGPSLAFAGVLVGATALVSGSVPAARVLRTDLHGVLQGGGARAPGARWQRRFVTLQLALSCAALVAAALTARGMQAASSFGGGLPGEEVLTARVHLGAVEEPERGSLLTRLAEGMTALPGATAGALALGAPGFGERGSPLELDGAVTERPADAPTVLANAVSSGFFELLGLEVRAGRRPDRADGEGPAVAWVNEAFVRRFSPGTDVLGRTVRVPALDSAWATVVGVVEDADLGEGTLLREDRVYLPLGRAAGEEVMLLVRSRGADGAPLAPALRATVSEVDPALPLTDVRTLADGHRFVTRAQSTLSTLGAAGGAAGAVVAAVGLYGLLAFQVRRRRREMGVRSALGARGAVLVRHVLAGALAQLLPALAVGLALAWVAAPALGLILVGQDPRSPAVFAGVGAGFLAVGLTAALVPALRASRVDPAETLRTGEG